MRDDSFTGILLESYSIYKISSINGSIITKHAEYDLWHNIRKL